MLPLFSGQAGGADLVPLPRQGGLPAVLAGQHRNQVDVIIAVPDGDPADGLVFLTAGDSPVRCMTSCAMAAHSSSDSIRSPGAARIAQCQAGRRVAPLAESGLRLLQQPGQLGEVRFPSGRSAGSRLAG